MNESELTLKQRKFIKHYLETGNASRSAKLAGYKSYHSGYETLKNPQVTMVFRELLDNNDLTHQRVADKINKLLDAKKIQTCDVYVKQDRNGKWKVNRNSNDFIEVDDNQAQQKALDTLIKVQRIIENNQNSEDDENKSESFEETFIKMIREADKRLEGENGFKITRKEYPDLDRTLTA